MSDLDPCEDCEFYLRRRVHKTDPLTDVGYYEWEEFCIANVCPYISLDTIQ